jgi:hypothetical protein
MVMLPTDNELVLTEQIPDPFKVQVPISVVPFKILTSPVGVPALLETVAVNVTDRPEIAGFADETMAVVVLTATAFTT